MERNDIQLWRSQNWLYVKDRSWCLRYCPHCSTHTQAVLSSFSLSSFYKRWTSWTTVCWSVFTTAWHRSVSQRMRRRTGRIVAMRQMVPYIDHQSSPSSPSVRYYTQIRSLLVTMFNFGDRHVALSSPYTIHFLVCASILFWRSQVNRQIKMIANFSCSTIVVQACLDFMACSCMQQWLIIFLEITALLCSLPSLRLV